MKMTTHELAAACGFAVAVQGETREITSVFTCDLLSWAMGRAREDCAWCTVMGNVNSIAVATLSDCACIVLCHDAVLMDDAKERAALEGVPVFTTQMPAFEAGVAIAKACGIL